MTTRLDLSWHDRTSDIPDRLWRACLGRPHEGLFWLRAIETGTVADQFRFQFGLLRQDGIAIGIVPAFLFDLPLTLVLPPGIARLVVPLLRGPFTRVGYLRTLFVGNVAGEEGRLGLLPGHDLCVVFGSSKCSNVLNERSRSKDSSGSASRAQTSPLTKRRFFARGSRQSSMSLSVTL